MKKILSFLAICAGLVLFLGLGVEQQEIIPDNALLAYNTKTKEYFNPLYLKESDDINDFVLRRRNEIDASKYKPNHEHVESGYFMGESTRVLFHFLGFKAKRPWGDNGDWGIHELTLLDLPGESMGEAYDSLRLAVDCVPMWWHEDLSESERKNIGIEIAKKYPKFQSLDKHNSEENKLYLQMITWYYLNKVYPEEIKKIYSSPVKKASKGSKREPQMEIRTESKFTKNPLANLYLDLKKNNSFI